MGKKLFNIPECGETHLKISACADHSRHCTSCGSPGGSHFVGGSRPDARVICDPTDRASYLALIKDAPTPGRRYREEVPNGDE